MNKTYLKTVEYLAYLLCKLSLLLGFIFLAPSAQAIDIDSYGLGYGILNSGMFKEAVESDGGTSTLGSNTLHFLNGDLYLKGSSKHIYQVRLAYTILPRETVDDSAKVTNLLLSGKVKFDLAPKFSWNTGGGYLVTRSKGAGGSVVLNNGGGTTTFFRPENSSTAGLIMWELGGSYKVNPNVYVSADLLVNGLFGEKRNINAFVNFSYLWNHRSTASKGRFSRPGSRRPAPRRRY